MKFASYFFIIGFLLFSPFAHATGEPPQRPFSKVAPGYRFSFPRDHGAHKDFKTEWWYFTGHLKTKEGRTFGFQWTVFRNALDSAVKDGERSVWRANQIYLGHAALSDLEKGEFHYFDGAFRGISDIAHASPERFSVSLPNFSGNSSETSLSLSAKEPSEKGIAMEMVMDLPPSVVFHGENGFSQKSEEAGHASYYYSLPQLRPFGNIRIGNDSYEVKGTAWMDHEFSTSHLSENQTGWDWMGLPLTDRSSLMIYRLRDRRGSERDYVSGTFIDESGGVHPLTRGDIQLKPSRLWKSPRSGGHYPLTWEIEIPRHRIRLTVNADIADQELVTSRSTQVTYWEGSVSVQGETSGHIIRSQGYLEMTGYIKNLKF